MNDKEKELFTTLLNDFSRGSGYCQYSIVKEIEEYVLGYIFAEFEENDIAEIIAFIQDEISFFDNILDDMLWTYDTYEYNKRTYFTHKESIETLLTMYSKRDKAEIRIDFNDLNTEENSRYRRSLILCCAIYICEFRIWLLNRLEKDFFIRAYS